MDKWKDAVGEYSHIVDLKLLEVRPAIIPLNRTQADHLCRVCAGRTPPQTATNLPTKQTTPNPTLQRHNPPHRSRRTLHRPLPDAPALATRGDAAVLEGVDARGG